MMYNFVRATALVFLAGCLVAVGMVTEYTLIRGGIIPLPKEQVCCKCCCCDKPCICVGECCPAGGVVQPDSNEEVYIDSCVGHKKRIK
jgi:hypothetical protein